jgi:hypothetical protein
MLKEFVAAPNPGFVFVGDSERLQSAPAWEMVSKAATLLDWSRSSTVPVRAIELEFAGSVKSTRPLFVPVRSEIMLIQAFVVLTVQTHPVRVMISLKFVVAPRPCGRIEGENE